MLSELTIREWVIIALGVLALLIVGRSWLRLWWARFRRERATRQRFRRGEEGELLAESILRRAGYDIVERQYQGSWELYVDGEPQTVFVYADYLVADEDGQYIAEAKTGRVAGDVGRAATRRQLLEYRHVFDVDGICLVDVESESIHWVDFSSDANPSGSSGALAGRKLSEAELTQ